MLDIYKLKILTESAKYDVSCSSSGSNRKNTANGLGNASYCGICHSFTQDGRCVSLLKILLTNICSYNCLYCVNRSSNDIPRAKATPDEICELVINFYKRNLIEGLFLSSAVEKSPDYTMEMLLDTVVKLRKVYNFNGYIHLKGIPGANQKLIVRAGQFVDRMSFNIELPSNKSLTLLAPQKNKNDIIKPMSFMAEEYSYAKKTKNNKFLTAGQTTQMIVGASPEKDGQILKLTESLYKKYSLKRVYFSSYIPMTTNKLLPSVSCNKLREHRLYQADWLLRFYGFTSSEILRTDDDLDINYDPKCMWAIKNPQFFPVEINKASLEMLIRVPGIGFNGAYKIINARKFTKLGFEHLVKMRIVIKRAKHFITCNGKFFGIENRSLVKNLLSLSDPLNGGTQISFCDQLEITSSVITGEL